MRSIVFQLFRRCFGGAVFGDLDRSGVRNADFGEFDIEGDVVDGSTFGQFDSIAFVNGAVFFGVVGVEGFSETHTNGGDFVIMPVADADEVGNASGVAKFDRCVVGNIDNGPFRSTAIFFEAVGDGKGIVIDRLRDFAKFDFVGDVGSLSGRLEASDGDRGE